MNARQFDARAWLAAVIMTSLFFAALLIRFPANQRAAISPRTTPAIFRFHARATPDHKSRLDLQAHKAVFSPTLIQLSESMTHTNSSRPSDDRSAPTGFQFAKPPLLAAMPPENSAKQTPTLMPPRINVPILPRLDKSPALPGANISTVKKINIALLQMPSGRKLDSSNLPLAEWLQLPGAWMLQAELAFDEAGHAKSVFVISSSLDQNQVTAIAQQLYRCRLAPPGPAWQGLLTLENVP